MVAAVGEIHQAWAVALLIVPGGQHLVDERRQLTGHGHLIRFGHVPQVERAQAFAATVVDGERGGAGFFVALLAHGNHDAVAADSQHGAMSPLGAERLFEPATGFLDLGGFTGASETVGERSRNFAERAHGPVHAVRAGERVQHLALLVIDGQTSDALGQSGRGQMGFESQQHIKGEERGFTRFASFVAKAAVRQGTKGGVDGFGLFRPAAIGFGLEGNAWRRLLQGGGFAFRQSVLQHASSRLAQAVLYLDLQFEERGGRGSLFAELIEEAL